jgi:predicted SnoaL-like aldol condensation-catalyzing enzyme
LLGLAAALALGMVAHAGESAQEQANIKAVKAFYNAALNRLDCEAAPKNLGAGYKQHNAAAAGGDYVILGVDAARFPGTLDNAIIGNFRPQDGKVVERWNSARPIPEKAANGNRMF